MSDDKRMDEVVQLLSDVWQEFRNMRVLMHARFCGVVTGAMVESCSACAHLAKLDHELQCLISDVIK